MRPLFLTLACFTASPALAQESDPLAPIEPTVATAPSTPATVPPASTMPSTGDVIHDRLPLPQAPKDWRGVFSAIRAGDWSSARAGIAALPDGPLKPLAKAELFTARNSPRVELEAVLSLLAEAPELPQAQQLQRMAISRGAALPPSIVSPQRLTLLGSSARRQRLAGLTGDPVADTLRAQLEPLVKADDATSAEMILTAQLPMLSQEGRAEASQRVAWIYYVTGRDSDARRVADSGRVGGYGEWSGQAAWISGLSAWRMGDCEASFAAFRDAARMIQDRDQKAASNYWAARSAQACRRPREVEPFMRAAAGLSDNFYGLIARETLGMSTKLPDVPMPALRGSANRPNVVRARELARIGEKGLADELLRYQAQIGPASEHGELIGLAAALELPGAQYYLAHNGPPGAQVQPAWRFPKVRWTPVNGWRIDPALAYAHSRQESDFRPTAVSPANATGLMQVLPTTASLLVRSRGTRANPGALTDPATNLEFGQSFIEMMRDSGATRGQILKTIAAYNAGPLPVGRWNAINDKGDPLLWLESVPYWETRHYIPAVMRNFWVYQSFEGAKQVSLHDLAEHRWPSFPLRPIR